VYPLCRYIAKQQDHNCSFTGIVDPIFDYPYLLQVFLVLILVGSILLYLGALCFLPSLLSDLTCVGRIWLIVNGEEKDSFNTLLTSFF